MTFTSTTYGSRTRHATSPRLYSLLLCLALFATLATGCMSDKASQKAPELPPRHWLEEMPGVPVENKEKLEAAVPNLYDPEKKFRFDDCVFLTIQQSPMLVNSAVDLEIKKVELTDAVWKYLPEPRMTLQATSNLTRNNEGSSDVSDNYGQPMFRVGFYATFPNPVMTYFNHQVQRIMVNLAISTHRKAIGAAIKDIAEIYLKLEAQRQIMEAQKSMLPLAKKLSAYWKQVEAVDGRQGVSLTLARQKEREAELKIERTQVQDVMLRTKLKILAGVDANQKLNLDTSDAGSILAKFDGKKMNWEERWPLTEDELLVRSQVKLQDYNIMVAWAKYVPDMSVSVNNNPPAGQYQPARGQEDTFVHLTFDFPLLDWGSRYRGVQTARMQKAKAFQEQARLRTKYSNVWLEAHQRLNLAETSLKLAKNTLEVAEMEAKEAEINFREGIDPFPAVAARKETLITARIAYYQAELDFSIAKLDWMDVANSLQERYLGPPAKEVF